MPLDFLSCFPHLNAPNTVFGGRGGVDGDAWWLWNLNWQTKYLEGGADLNLFKTNESENSSDWVTSSDTSDGGDSGGNSEGEESGVDHWGGGRERSDSTGSVDSEW